MKKFAEKYFHLLHNDCAGLNLTAISDFQSFYEKQILDSILPLEKSAKFQETLSDYQLLVDIGFGGGFPILPLAFMNKDLKYIGFEAKRKKVEAVKNIKDQLGLNFVKLYAERVENIFFDKKCVLTFKAVGTCKDFLKKIHTDQEIFVFFYKGPNFYKLEGQDLKREVKSWELIEEKFIEVENTDGRWLIGFKRKLVPHRTTTGMEKTNKSLVNLSDFL